MRMHDNRKLARGFSGKELAVVILVLFGIGAMVLPNLFTTRRRATVSRVKADMRSLATALEYYFVDHKSYPAMRPLADTVAEPEAIRAAGGGSLSTYECGRGEGMLAGLTTPVSYISSPFADGCSKVKDAGYAYHVAPESGGWILISTGPDADYDIANPAKVYDPRGEIAGEALMQISYDPTNGAFSNGDVWRVKQ